MDYGEQQGLGSLEQQELVHAARYTFDVWCCGYNWLQSNRESGRHLKEYIDNTVLRSYREKDVLAEKVIIITHSMGGLVSRALTELHGSENVLGVVHGVQPATGAPAFYRNVRCGYEGIEQVVLGRNSGEVTAVIAQAPGALELAPAFDYDDGRPWLYFRDRQGKDLLPPLPSAGNPYSEIYAAAEWHGLVPAANTHYLDLSRPPSQPLKKEPRNALRSSLKQVERFHHQVERRYFKKTLAHYGADGSRHSWQTLQWKGDVSSIGRSGILDDGNGKYGAYISSGGIHALPVFVPVFALEPGPRNGGDGTVPESSGAAPGRAGVEASFCHGEMGNGLFNTVRGYEHQGSYLDVRAEWATLFSVAKIAQAADWHA